MQKQDFNFQEMLAKHRHIRYGRHSFSAVCPICGEPITADESIGLNPNFDFPIDECNATCQIHGRVKMNYDGVIVDSTS